MVSTFIVGNLNAQEDMMENKNIAKLNVSMLINDSNPAFIQYKIMSKVTTAYIILVLRATQVYYKIPVDKK